MSLHSLKKFTSYQIIVQAYNKEGVGPASNTLVATTMEDGIPTLLYSISKKKIRLVENKQKKQHCHSTVKFFPLFLLNF
jgi:hypothetical protein